jgi:serine/threonine-protein kinase
MKAVRTPDISSEAIELQLERILGSKPFRTSGRMSRFLKFAVEEFVEGRAGDLKETVLGVEVFDRDTSYDSRADPVVRVEARRLRDKLREYYEGEGVEDRVIIEFPKGGYAPAFRSRLAPSRAPARWPGFALVAVAACCLGLIYEVKFAAPGRSSQQSDLSSVAVLPFIDMSPNKDQGYFCDGLTEELIHALTKVEGLRVPARTSVFQLRGADLRKIASQLQVGTVLEGSLRKDGNRIRVTAQLVRVSDNSHLWSETYDRDAGSIFSIQDEISRAIVNKLRVQLAGGTDRRLVKSSTENSEAYNLYLRGRDSLNRFTRGTAESAVGFFEQAIEKDPKYAQAYAGLADSYTEMAFFGALSPKAAYPKAILAATKALQLDDVLAEAHVALATPKMTYEWDWASAEREYKRALELNPNDANARRQYGLQLLYQGKFQESIREMRRSQDLDPLSARTSRDLSAVLYHARLYDQAIEECHKTLSLDPSYVRAYHTLGRAYLQKGMYTQAIAALTKLPDAAGAGFLGYANAVSGRRTEAMEILKKLKEKDRSTGVAIIYAGLGDKDRAFEWLEKAYEDHAYLLTLKVNPESDPLRSDPRFDSLLRRMGLAN